MSYTFTALIRLTYSFCCMLSHIFIHHTLSLSPHLWFAFCSFCLRPEKLRKHDLWFSAVDTKKKRVFTSFLHVFTLFLLFRFLQFLHAVIYTESHHYVVFCHLFICPFLFIFLVFVFIVCPLFTIQYSQLLG